MEDGDDSNSAGKKTSKKLCVAQTLEKNLNNINLKSFDLEFDVDPLFHKMSMAFDEGGAKGMLLNNLSTHDGCDLIFDTQDVHACDDGAATTSSLLPTAPNLDISGVLGRFSHINSDAQTLEICPLLGRLYDDKSKYAALLNADGETSDNSVGNDDDGEDEALEEMEALAMATGTSCRAVTQ